MLVFQRNIQIKTLFLYIFFVGLHTNLKKEQLCKNFPIILLNCDQKLVLNQNHIF